MSDAAAAFVADKAVKSTTLRVLSAMDLEQFRVAVGASQMRQTSHPSSLTRLPSVVSTMSASSFTGRTLGQLLFANMDIGPLELRTLASLLHVMPSAHELDLSGNPLVGRSTAVNAQSGRTLEGLKALAWTLSQHKALRSLKLNSVGSQGPKAAAVAYRQEYLGATRIALPHVVLKKQNSAAALNEHVGEEPGQFDYSLVDEPEALVLLIDALIESKSIMHLELCDNAIMAGGVRKLAELVKLTPLRNLFLADNALCNIRGSTGMFDPASFVTFCSEIKHSAALSWLNLNDCAICGLSRAEMQVHSQSDPTTKLHAAPVPLSGQFTVQALSALCDAIRDHPSLVQLTLQRNWLGNSGCKAVCSALMPEQQESVLDEMDEDGADDELLQHRHGLKHLDLSHNEIGLTGGRFIHRLLMRNRRLRFIALEMNQLSVETEIQMLCEFQAYPLGRIQGLPSPNNPAVLRFPIAPCWRFSMKVGFGALLSNTSSCEWISNRLSMQYPSVTAGGNVMTTLMLAAKLLRERSNVLVREYSTTELYSRLSPFPPRRVPTHPRNGACG